MPFLQQWLYSQFFVTPTLPTHDFTGKTVIVTGSNIGLGLESARLFARLNCEKLILGVRSISKGQAAKESILSSEKRKEDFIEVWELDLSSTTSTKAFAKRAQNLSRVDVLVENAGKFSSPTWTVTEGFEQTIQVNVICTLLLALLMLPKLRETAQAYGTTPHLEIVSSEGHHTAAFKERNEPDIYEAINKEGTLPGVERYWVSKLFEILFIRELVKTVKVPPVIPLVNPGFCRSNIGHEYKNGLFGVVLALLTAVIARTTEVGARTLVTGACAGPQSHGEYMSDGENRNVEDWIRTTEGAVVQKRVYEQTMAVLERIEPGISKNIA